jgi:C4-dicarboxylate transporter DctQ subunit
MFVWMAKFGAAYGVRTGIHVGVDVLINRLTTGMRGKFIVFGLLAGALFTGIVGTLGAHFVWENGAHYAFFSFAGHDDRRQLRRADHARPRVADLDRLQRHSARFVADVLPLPAGDLELLKTGELPHHDHGHVDGLEEEVPPVDFDPYGMDDNLHMHDLKHTMVRRRRAAKSVAIREAIPNRNGDAADDDKKGDQQ